MCKLCLAVFISISLLILNCNHAFAVKCGCDGLSGAYIASIEYATANYEMAKQTLVVKPQSEWTRSEEEDYLFWSLLLVYYAHGLYLEEFGNNHPMDEQSVMAMGYLAEWPVNLYTGEQVTVRSVQDGFHAGDIALEICPYEYSIRGKCVSFSMFIFGPSEDWPTSPVQPLPTNAAWSMVPSGAVHVTGMTTETDAEREERKEYFRKMLEKLAAQEEDDEDATKSEGE